MTAYKKKSTSSKRRKKKHVFTKAQYDEVKKIDRQQEWKRAPMLRTVRSSLVPINDSTTVDISPAFSAFQCPYQDIELALNDISSDAPDKDKRTGAEIYPQYLECSFTVNRSRDYDNMPTPPDPNVYENVCQRFRVSVVRYVGEMDFQVVNSTNLGWHLLNTQTIHICKPGEMWSDKQYVKNQVQVLYDKDFSIERYGQIGTVCKIKCPIRKKLTYETDLAGHSAVGAGNIFIVVSSNMPWQMMEYHTYGFYKEL